MQEPQIKAKYRQVAIYYCGECLGNAEQACIKAGYSPRYARGHACKIIADSSVQEYIKYLREQTWDTEIMTIKDIQMFWSKVIRDDGNELKHRLRASELLAKAQGAFTNDW